MIFFTTVACILFFVDEKEKRRVRIFRGASLFLPSEQFCCNPLAYVGQNAGLVFAGPELVGRRRLMILFARHMVAGSILHNL